MIAAAPLGKPIHTTDFAAAARSSSGDAAVVDGAVAMAWTVADLWLGEGVLAAARSEHAASLARVGPDAVRSALGGGCGTYDSGPRRRPGPRMTVYIAADLTPDQADVLRRDFPNLHRPAFALFHLQHRPQ